MRPGPGAWTPARARTHLITDNGDMCRSIKTLREPYTEHVTEADVRAAALQYVRKISGFRAPAAHNAEAFDRAVDSVASATQVLLDQLEVRGAR
jgi:hypothetical protein